MPRLAPPRREKRRTKENGKEEKIGSCGTLGTQLLQIAVQVEISGFV